MVKRKGGNKKRQALHLSEFLGDAAGAPAQPAPVIPEKAVTDLSYVPPVDNNPSCSVDLSALPSAPRAQREGSFDPSKIPRQPPYTAYVGNLPFDSEDDDVRNMFQRNTVKEVRLLKDKDNGRFKGFGYVEFESAEGLIEALKINEKMVRGRPIKVDVATQGGQKDGDSGGRWERGQSNERGERQPYVDNTSDDWRRDVRPQEDREPAPYRQKRDYGDRDNRDTRRFNNSDDNFSRSDFGTKQNDPPKEPYKLDERPRAPRRDRDENPWVKRGENAHDDDAMNQIPKERPKFNIKARTVPLTEEQKALKAAAEAKPTATEQRREPDGRENKPKANPFGAARPTDTASWRSSRVQGTGPIKTPLPQGVSTKDVSDEIIQNSNKFLVLDDEIDNQL